MERLDLELAGARDPQRAESMAAYMRGSSRSSASAHRARRELPPLSQLEARRGVQMGRAAVGATRASP
jgi:hypothetical protein